MEDIIIECLRIYGFDTYYMPRKAVNEDLILGEDALNKYEHAYPLEMYMQNVNGFEGDGDLLSKFGVEVRDQITFSVALRVFENEVGSVLRRDRPSESDLIFFPFTKALYTIKYVNKKPIFYQMGALQMYDVVCELFEYSNEIFNTGIDIIDKTYNAFLTTTDPFIALTENSLQILTEDGFHIIKEEYDIDYLDQTSQNDIFEAEGLDFLDFTERDPFSESDRRA